LTKKGDNCVETGNKDSGHKPEEDRKNVVLAYTHDSNEIPETARCLRESKLKMVSPSTESRYAMTQNLSFDAR
jgi:hypothetical protein